jgi:toxin ParE1/3/4
MPHIIKRAAAKRDLTQHFVWFAEEAGIEVARRFLKSAEKSFHNLAEMPRMGLSISTACSKTELQQSESLTRSRTTNAF